MLKAISILLKYFFVSPFITEKKNILIESDTAVLLEHDTEAISLSWKSVKCVETSLNLCLEKRRQVDTLAVDQLLWKLNSSKFKIYACTSPINRAGFLYFADHLNTKDEQQPLCDGAHFQEYMINTDQSVIIHIDSLWNNKPENHTSQKIANLYFESNSKHLVQISFQNKEIVWFQQLQSMAGGWVCKLGIKPTSSIRKEWCIWDSLQPY